MAKIVRYNGGTMSYYGCSEPTELVIGKTYEVISENDRGWQEYLNGFVRAYKIGLLLRISTKT